MNPAKSRTNHQFERSVLSGMFVAAQDVTATWLMHDLGASSFSLSLTWRAGQPRRASSASADSG